MLTFIGLLVYTPSPTRCLRGAMAPPVSNNALVKSARPGEAHARVATDLRDHERWQPAQLLRDGEVAKVRRELLLKDLGDRRAHLVCKRRVVGGGELDHIAAAAEEAEAVHAVHHAEARSDAWPRMVAAVPHIVLQYVQTAPRRGTLCDATELWVGHGALGDRPARDPARQGGMNG